jgi:spore coat protein U-like protein
MTIQPRHPIGPPLQLLVAAFAVAALAGQGASAAAVTGSFGVTANVTVNCKVTGTTLAFGAYDPTSPTALDGTSVLTVTCTKGAVVASVQLDQGVNAAGGTQRQMSAGAAITNVPLVYNLYTDTGRSLAWTAATTGNGFTSAGPSTPNTLTVFGRIPIGQNVPAGAYSDTVIATVNF